MPQARGQAQLQDRAAGDEFRLIETELSAVATYPAEIDFDTLERELFSED